MRLLHFIYQKENIYYADGENSYRREKCRHQGGINHKDHLKTEIEILFAVSSVGPFAILELLATATISTLKKHFSQVSTYAQCLCPDEFWVVHFSRADDLLSSPYWPDESLLHQKLGMIHIWHDKQFKTVRLNAKFSFLNEIKTITDMQILP